MTPTAPRQRRASARSRAEPPKNQPLLVAAFWIRAHCVVPDGFRRGQPFTPYGWQDEYFANFYLVRGDAVWVPANPLLRTAFVYAMGLVVGPQKLGKDPMEAAQVCLEGVGPALFAGWAGPDEGYACIDHGCHCGWEYAYDPGEPKGMPWPTPLVQITAVSEDATQNTYDALRPMIELGPLADLIPKTGEEFIRLPNGGRIDTVTASALSRLGQRVTFVSQGEAGLYTKTNGMVKVADTQHRGLAGMGGRASLHTNAWDPSEHSTAQTLYESSATDIYRQFTRPPAGLSMKVKDERWRILRAVYPADTRRENGGHADLEAIEDEVARLVLRDPAQAARFFGNQLVTGGGKAFDPLVWKALTKDYRPASGSLITLGFDGSRSGDWSALIATEITSGFQWPLGIWNPAQHPGHEIPRSVVDQAVDDAMAAYSVWRFYVDPPYWKDELAAWQGKYGETVVLPWETYRPRPIGAAVRNYATAISTAQLHHDGDETFAAHIGNAYRRSLQVRDDKGEAMWTLAKETPDSGLKIDAAMAAILSWEARTDAIAAGVGAVFRSNYEDEGLTFVGSPLTRSQ